MDWAYDMRKSRYFFFSVLLIFFSGACWADCDDQYLHVLTKKFKLAPEPEEGFLWAYSACKTNPANKNQIIAAIAFRQHGTKNNNREQSGDYDLGLAILDEKSNQIIASSLQRNRFTSDGYIFNGIEIDTANYRVSDSARAFGVRARFGIDMGFQSAQELSLFIPSGTSIKELLSNLEVEISFHFENAPVGSLLRTRRSQRTVSLSPQKHKGFYDILINEKIIDRDYVRNDTGEEKNELFETHQKTYVVRFRNTNYEIPPELRSFECRIC